MSAPETALDAAWDALEDALDIWASTDPTSREWKGYLIARHRAVIEADAIDTERARLLPYIRHAGTCYLQAVRDNAPDDELCSCGLATIWDAP